MRRFLGAAAAAALLLVPALALGSDRFTDVPTSAYFHDSVNNIADANVTAGCGATTFCPAAFVTRGDMAVFLDRVLGNPQPVVHAESVEYGAFGTSVLAVGVNADPTTSGFTAAYPPGHDTGLVLARLSAGRYQISQTLIAWSSAVALVTVAEAEPDGATCQASTTATALVVGCAIAGVPADVDFQAVIFPA